MGTGELTRYLGSYGSKRVRKAALLGAVPPFLLKTDDNPEGLDSQVFEDIKVAIVQDRYAYFEAFLNDLGFGDSAASSARCSTSTALAAQRRPMSQVPPAIGARPRRRPRAPAAFSTVPAAVTRGGRAPATVRS
jgi:hypothetical protein